MGLQYWMRILVLLLVLDSFNIQANCQKENRILHSVSGVWTTWGPWSDCSSSCGKGVTLRTHKCQRDNMEVSCVGEPRQYKSCQSMLCPEDSVPFRDVQCTLYNNRPIPGSSQRYHWVPFYGAPIPCDLNCLAVGYNFYYTFGRVLDGTSCWPDSDGTCINGQCQTAGCDGILGSGVMNDRCGNCGGQNDSCVHIQDVYRLPYPLTALMSLSKGYVINGNWEISRSGVYKVAGTEVRYSRVTASHEFLEVLGPTNEDLYVLVLFQEQNPGIEYEYWLPKERFHNMQKDSQVPLQPLDLILEAWVRTPTSTSAGDTMDDESKKAHSNDITDCQKCMQLKGRAQRKKHYCHSDFVIHGKVLGQKTIGQETRYDILIKHVYRNKFPLVHQEYIWVSNKCNCPKLQDHEEYIMMPSRHVNYERTLNRILLTINSYIRPWSQREENQMQRLSRLCRESS
ncbi:ADAMTS-like protein 5 isoform X3 [Dendrobates tinctorius]|uniref:ADAMTS-like protein 5 isoform X3 n=1 Tax=Dendrobates tinctorius TaxID=92724 RepID=UPI003CC9DD64